MDFEAVAAQLLSQADSLLRAWFPEGRRRGHEYVVGSLAGEPGESLSINVHTGVWKDFAAGPGGSDLVSLYAAIHNLSQGEALRQLTGETKKTSSTHHNPAPATIPYRPVKPNGSAGGFEGEHNVHGLPYALYAYRDRAGEVLFFTARYHTESGKTFLPWTYDGERWRPKAWPAPRPLYGLEQIDTHPEATVVVVEGEKCVEAFKSYLTAVIAVSWWGGAAGVAHTDWTALAGRRVVLWPDADEPGRAAMQQIAELILDQVADLRTIDTTDRPDGWDVADLIASVPSGQSVAKAVASFVREHAEHLKKSPPVLALQPIEPVAPQSVGEATIATPQDSDGASATVKRQETPPRLMFRFEDEAWNHYELLRGSGNKAAANMESAHRVAARHPDTRDNLWFDVFRNRLMVGEREWTDRDTLQWTYVLQREVRLPKMSAAAALDGALLYAHERERHPLKEWLESCGPWDGVSRLEQLFSRGFGTPDSEYARAVGLSFGISAIARVYKPGEMVKTMVVLEGPEDLGKSQALGILGREWYLDCTERLESKDFYQALQGYWIIELAELAGMMRSSAEATKACISRRDDVYRASYGRVAQSHPRQCIFAGSTNNVDWQSDDAGGVRFLPIACKHVDLAWLRDVRDHLWAEARHRYLAGEPWWKIPVEQAAVERATRNIEDPWTPALTSYLASRIRTTVSDCLAAIGIDRPSDMKNADAYRMARVLKQLGWVQKFERVDGHNVRVYVPEAMKWGTVLPK